MKVLIALIISTLLSVLIITPPSASAATRRKVTIVVGPVGAKTQYYKDIANSLARQAKNYGANVSKIYSPYATWRRVKRASKGANLFIYLGHGNGWPSPYSPYNKYTKDGLGLNRSSGNGNYNVKYYGAYYVRNSLHFAKDAVVILNHLCYASGSSEPGHGYPSKDTAIKRVDNYADPFIGAGAKAVFAYGYSADRIIRGLFKSNKTMREIFWDGPNATPRTAIKRTSKHHSTYGLILDPYGNLYYRSIVAKLGMTAKTWRNS